MLLAYYSYCHTRIIPFNNKNEERAKNILDPCPDFTPYVSLLVAYDHQLLLDLFLLSSATTTSSSNKRSGKKRSTTTTQRGRSGRRFVSQSAAAATIDAC